MVGRGTDHALVKEAASRRMPRIGATVIVALAVSFAAGGCPAPRQRDKDQQTGMGPVEHGVVRATDDAARETRRPLVTWGA